MVLTFLVALLLQSFEEFLIIIKKATIKKKNKYNLKKKRKTETKHINTLWIKMYIS